MSQELLQQLSQYLQQLEKLRNQATAELNALKPASSPLSGPGPDFSDQVIDWFSKKFGDNKQPQTKQLDRSESLQKLLAEVANLHKFLSDFYDKLSAETPQSSASVTEVEVERTSPVRPASQSSSASSSPSGTPSTTPGRDPSKTSGRKTPGSTPGRSPGRVSSTSPAYATSVSPNNESPDNSGAGADTSGKQRKIRKKKKGRARITMAVIDSAPTIESASIPPVAADDGTQNYIAASVPRTEDPAPSAQEAAAAALQADYQRMRETSIEPIPAAVHNDLYQLRKQWQIYLAKTSKDVMQAEETDKEAIIAKNIEALAQSSFRELFDKSRARIFKLASVNTEEKTQKYQQKKQSIKLSLEEQRQAINAIASNAIQLTRPKELTPQTKDFLAEFETVKQAYLNKTVAEISTTGLETEYQNIVNELEQRETIVEEYSQVINEYFDQLNGYRQKLQSYTKNNNNSDEVAVAHQAKMLEINNIHREIKEDLESIQVNYLTANRLKEYCQLFLKLTADVHAVMYSEQLDELNVGLKDSQAYTGVIELRDELRSLLFSQAALDVVDTSEGRQQGSPDNAVAVADLEAGNADFPRAKQNVGVLVSKEAAERRQKSLNGLIGEILKPLDDFCQNSTLAEEKAYSLAKSTMADARDACQQMASGYLDSKTLSDDAINELAAHLKHVRTELTTLTETKDTLEKSYAGLKETLNSMLEQRKQQQLNNFKQKQERLDVLEKSIDTFNTQKQEKLAELAQEFTALPDDELTFPPDARAHLSKLPRTVVGALFAENIKVLDKKYTALSDNIAKCREQLAALTEATEAAELGKPFPENSVILPSTIEDALDSVTTQTRDALMQRRLDIITKKQEFDKKSAEILTRMTELDTIESEFPNVFDALIKDYQQYGLDSGDINEVINTHTKAEQERFAAERNRLAKAYDEYKKAYDSIADTALDAKFPDPVDPLTTDFEASVSNETKQAVIERLNAMISFDNIQASLRDVEEYQRQSKSFIQEINTLYNQKFFDYTEYGNRSVQGDGPKKRNIIDKTMTVESKIVVTEINDDGNVYAKKDSSGTCITEKHTKSLTMVEDMQAAIANLVAYQQEYSDALAELSQQSNEQANDGESQLSDTASSKRLYDYKKVRLADVKQSFVLRVQRKVEERIKQVVLDTEMHLDAIPDEKRNWPNFMEKITVYDKNYLQFCLRIRQMRLKNIENTLKLAVGADRYQSIESAMQTFYMEIAKVSKAIDASKDNQLQMPACLLRGVSQAERTEAGDIKHAMALSVEKLHKKLQQQFILNTKQECLTVASPLHVPGSVPRAVSAEAMANVLCDPSQTEDTQAELEFGAQVMCGDVRGSGTGIPRTVNTSRGRLAANPSPIGATRKALLGSRSEDDDGFVLVGATQPDSGPQPQQLPQQIASFQH